MKRVIVVGGGFAGLAVARKLGQATGLEVLVLDKRNHHVFQPLLYQVAMAQLSPADIAAPIRAILRNYTNTRVLQAEVLRVEAGERLVHTDGGSYEYDYLVLACGSLHSYFGHNEWETHAPGLKTLEQATEIRRRVLDAFEKAECAEDEQQRKRLQTYIIVGGGPTGVELAGALAEMSRITLARDFRRIDPRKSRIILVEALSRILPMYPESLSARAKTDLEKLGVEVKLESPVSSVASNGVQLGEEFIEAATVLWAAGIQASKVGETLDAPKDRQGRLHVRADLSLEVHPEIFVIGDLAHLKDKSGQPLPAIAPVAMQQGNHCGLNILREASGMPRKDFHYFDKGTMATIGRHKAVAHVRMLKLAGIPAWWAWLFVHIMYLVGFRNRLLVLIQWFWSYITFRRGARLIVPKDWQFFPSDTNPEIPRSAEEFKNIIEKPAGEERIREKSITP